MQPIFRFGETQTWDMLLTSLVLCECTVNLSLEAVCCGLMYTVFIHAYICMSSPAYKCKS
jgi:hypothetical protein